MRKAYMRRQTNTINWSNELLWRRHPLRLMAAPPGYSNALDGCPRVFCATAYTASRVTGAACRLQYKRHLYRKEEEETMCSPKI